ncbi:MAG: ADP-ribosyltransferase domain-containing protein [Pseudomonadota bacterium]
MAHSATVLQLFLGGSSYRRLTEAAENQSIFKNGHELGLTHEEALAIYAYSTEPNTKEATYVRINQFLRQNRSTTPDIDQAYGLLLQKALFKLPIYVGWTQRNATLPPHVLEKIDQLGQFVDPAFLSSSRGESPFEGNDVFILYSRTGRNISSLSRFQGETEILYLPNTYFSVQRFGRDEKGCIIYAKEVE